jgi:hypothetical protein
MVFCVQQQSGHAGWAYPIEAGLLPVALGPRQIAQPVILGFSVFAGAVVEGCLRGSSDRGLVTTWHTWCDDQGL